MARVLMIDDESDHLEILHYNLTQAGHQAFGAPTGKEGIALAREVLPDIVLLDWMLPDVAGTAVAEALRSDPQTQSIRIIMVTARTDESDRVGAFEAGADDYIVKPFSVRELLLRVEAVLRRGKAPERRLLEADELRIDKEARSVTVANASIRLTKIEFTLLVALIERRGRVQTRGTLIADVWALDPKTRSRTVDTHVKRLREKLGPAGRFIETVRGVGYRFSEARSGPGDTGNWRSR